MNRCAVYVLALALSLMVPGSHAREAHEYTDQELISAGWSRSQIDEMRSTVAGGTDSSSAEATGSKEDYITGVWTGVGVQENGSEWTIQMSMGSGQDRIEYSSIPCSGTLELLSQTGSEYVYREKITKHKNNCVDNGRIVANVIDANTMDWKWYYPNGKIGGTSRITKTPASSRSSTDAVTSVGSQDIATASSESHSTDATTGSAFTPPALEYISENTWAGRLVECCRRLNLVVLPATVTFDGESAQLQTRGRWSCDVEYKRLVGEYRSFSLNGETIKQDLYEATREQSGNCRRMNYFSISKGKNAQAPALGLILSRRKKGSIDFNSFFEPSSDSISMVVACERLVNSATKGNITGVRSSLKKNVSPNCKFNQETPLYNAVRHVKRESDSNLPVVKLLVEAGANLTTKDRNTGATPTTLAAYLGHRRTTEYLLSAGGTADDLKEAQRLSKAKSNQILTALGLGFVGGDWLAGKIGEALKEGSKVPSVSVVAKDVCGVLNQCTVTNLQVTGNNRFDKILDDSDRGVIVADSESELSGRYNYSVNLDDKICTGEFTINNGVTTVELDISDNCRLLSVIQN